MIVKWTSLPTRTIKLLIQLREQLNLLCSLLVWVFLLPRLCFPCILLWNMCVSFPDLSKTSDTRLHCVKQNAKLNTEQKIHTPRASRWHGWFTLTQNKWAQNTKASFEWLADYELLKKAIKIQSHQHSTKENKSMLYLFSNRKTSAS